MFDEKVRAAVHDVVQHQVDIGLDIVNDGEQGKISYAHYVKDRLTGFGVVEQRHAQAHIPADRRNHPDFYEYAQGGPAPAPVPERQCCTGPIEWKDFPAVEQELELFREATSDSAPREAFLTAPSPGIISVWFPNEFYATEEEYLAALADAMKREYTAIVEAGFILQVDCPDLAAALHIEVDQSTEAVRRVVAQRVEAINAALADLPPDRLRMHLCWGANEAPHSTDVPLRDIVDLVLQARPNTMTVAAANGRHEHEWKVWGEIDLPEDKAIVGGVIDSTTNIIEHPEVVAERILRFTSVVDPSRFIAGVDCGLATFAEWGQVAPTVAWAKLASLVEGARLATKELQGG
jgi:5-methyltetrahydropteroyltriglutamate--homocysteine methyltransferase